MCADRHLLRQAQGLLRRAGISAADSGLSISLLAGGGSDRCFYRVSAGADSYVIMAAGSARHEVRPYVDIGRFLHARHAAGPEILLCDEGRGLVLLEDLGDDSLLARLGRAASRAQVCELYREVLAFLAELQADATCMIAGCASVRDRQFGYESFRWESDYFAECFLRRLCGISSYDNPRLDDELHELAIILDQQPRVFMHRDFQSQNIYMKQGRVRVIDFQSAAMGLAQYDLASVLKDAYFILDAGEREGLVRFFIDRLAHSRGAAIEPEGFFRLFHYAGLQRNMQALGAFAFLSMEKGKTAFRQYIPAGLAYLQEALSLLAQFPVLGELAEQAAEALRVRREA